MEAIVLAGGFGTRLASRLDGVPKPMAPVAGVPFLEILLNALLKAGCSRTILSVGYLHHVIERHFGESFHGMALEYSVETTPLGTGGAIRAALAQASEPSVLVLNGDTFLEVDFAAVLAFHRSHSADLTLTVAHQPDIARYGEVLLEGERGERIFGFQEKGRSGPGWINAGVYVLGKDIRWPEGLAESFSFESSFLVPEVGHRTFAAFASRGLFLDIGIPEDLDRAQTLLARFVRP